MHATNAIVTQEMLTKFWAAAKIVRVSARWSEDWTDWGQQQILSISEWVESRKADCLPAPLKTFLNMIYSKSRTETAEKKKELRKITVAHPLMQFCKNEGYLSPLLWRLNCFFSKCRGHDFLWTYCTRLGSQFHTRRYSSSINVLLYLVNVQWLC